MVTWLNAIWLKNSFEWHVRFCWIYYNNVVSYDPRVDSKLVECFVYETVINFVDINVTTPDRVVVLYISDYFCCFFEGYSSFLAFLDEKIFGFINFELKFAE